ncbi:hypothetical protein AX17_005266 [Amanita inopinata Kibby_2008]|nr:hypothetical protein AX17_005266 [Amanita inopinata Kibby_2008]
MGKSAKLHKRIPKKLKSTSSSSTTTTNNNNSASSSQSKVQTAKKRTDLKAKTSKSKNNASQPGQHREGGVLGGADYVTLLMGGRRKARKEAEKLPRDDEDL